MKTWIDFDSAAVFAIPLLDEPGVCEGMLIEGPQGWGEFSPPEQCDGPCAGRWLTAAIEVGTVGWPDPLRGRVPVSVHVPAVGPERAAQIVRDSGCVSAAVDLGPRTADDVARLAAVREALGPAGMIRCDAAGRWDPATAASVVPELEQAAQGLEFIEDPCATTAEIASLRGELDVPVAVGRLLRDATAAGVEPASFADVAVLRVGALGGVRRALRVAETCGLPCVARSGRESSVGVAGSLALAGVLPDAGYAHHVGGAALLSGDLVSAGRSLRVADGWLPVAPMPPGPDPARLRRFAVTDTATISRWRDRLAGAQQYI